MSAPDKRDLRHAARARRRELAAAMDREASSTALAEAVLRFVPDPARVAVYESLPDEPPTGLLVEALLDTGHEVIVPVVLDDYSLQWRYAVRGATGDRVTVSRPARLGHSPISQDQDGWLGTDALATCDLVVTPGLSVDAHGTRLGQGGGCYDRALLHRDPAAPVITLLHEGEQSEADLPSDDHDVPVDGYVTTTGRVVRLRHDATASEGARGDQGVTARDA
ncbi:MAG: 5-formyltetrahydrofolate cyclo-ligase [Dermatophilaceae bacterium]|nr:5-formyltetrahydrofolate cyclo-ligase [Dermatophilaceae bacterium]NUO92008.1 5-formyltetrahydrofolate cyclo-ligase [Dermatophilaceae bacterium]NUR16884.1 5-formyltetrahydrofolate cyclo-ligase [Dermatophilaceae bacterium]NUR79357.1 5-formyltetrahydrofolate cyclo-ligase [Dermatophilaceae bacterium]